MTSKARSHQLNMPSANSVLNGVDDSTSSRLQGAPPPRAMSVDITHMPRLPRSPTSPMVPIGTAANGSQSLFTMPWPSSMGTQPKVSQASGGTPSRDGAPRARGPISPTYGASSLGSISSSGGSPPSPALPRLGSVDAPYVALPIYGTPPARRADESRSASSTPRTSSYGSSSKVQGSPLLPRALSVDAPYIPHGPRSPTSPMHPVHNADLGSKTSSASSESKRIASPGTSARARVVDPKAGGPRQPAVQRANTVVWRAETSGSPILPRAMSEMLYLPLSPASLVPPTALVDPSTLPRTSSAGLKPEHFASPAAGTRTRVPNPVAGPMSPPVGLASRAHSVVWSGQSPLSPGLPRAMSMDMSYAHHFSRVPSPEAKIEKRVQDPNDSSPASSANRISTRANSVALFVDVPGSPMQHRSMSVDGSYSHHSMPFPTSPASTEGAGRQGSDAVLQTSSTAHKPKDTQVGLEYFIVLDRIGTGGSGTVVTAKGKFDGKTYAIKAVRKAGLAHAPDLANLTYEDILREVSVMQTLHHPFIIPLVCSFQSPSHLFIVMPFLSGGEVFTLMKAITFPESALRIHAAQLTLALDHVHDMGFVYRDMKPDNILLDEGGNCILTDFGMITARGVLYKDCDPGGTPGYLAPEVRTSKPTDPVLPAGDWWGLGLVLFEMSTGIHPFMRPNGSVDMNAVLFSEPNFDELAGDLSEGLRNLISSLLAKSPDTRLCGKKSIMLHEWFVGLDWDGVLSKVVKPMAEEFLWADVLEALVPEEDRFDAACRITNYSIESAPDGEYLEGFDCISAEVATALRAFSLL